MDRITIQQRIKDQLSNDTYFTDTEINNLINDAIVDMSKFVNARDDSVSFSTVLNQKEYNLPDGLVEVHQVTVSNNRIERLSLAEILKLYSTGITTTPNLSGTPSCYYIRKLTNANTSTTVGGDPLLVTPSRNIIGFYPTPASVETVEIFYTSRPSSLTLDGDVPAFPEEYHKTIVLYCLHWLKQKDNEYDQALYYKRLYEEDTLKMKLEMDGEQPNYINYIEGG